MCVYRKKIEIKRTKENKREKRWTRETYEARRTEKKR